MRITLPVVFSLSLLAPVAFAGPTKKIEQGPIKVEAKMIAADRSGQQEFPKITGTNSDAKSDFTVRGRIELRDKNEQTLKECPFDVVLVAGKSASWDLRDCTAPVAHAMELLVDAIAEAAPLEAPPF